MTGIAPSDDELIERTKKGEPRALDSLVQRYESRVFSFLLRMLRHPADAEDLTQEVFVRMFKSLPGYQSRGMFGAWLFTIARNSCKTFVEKRSRECRVVTPAAIPDESPAPRPSPEGLGEEGIEGMLACLPEDFRRVVVLKYVSELSCSEIGLVEGISEVAVRQRLHRARLLIRDRLESS